MSEENEGWIYIPTYPHRERVKGAESISTLNGSLDDLIHFLEDVKKECGGTFCGFEFRVLGDNFEIWGYRRQGGAAILNNKSILNGKFE